MAEIEAILDLWRASQGAGGVLGTVVRVQGSSYRRPGARIYVSGAAHAGSISGGCLEGDLVRKARWLTRTGAAVQTYSTVFDDPFGNAAGQACGNLADVPYGLGCGGVIDVLLEPADLPEMTAILRALEAAQRGELFYSATRLPAREASGCFARVITAENGGTVFASSGLLPVDKSELTMLAKAAGEQGSGPQIVEDQKAGIFVERIQPPQRLIVFGAGDDARPLVEIARLLGWRVVVADGRASLATRARFPAAGQLLTLAPDLSNMEDLHIHDQDAVTVLTHSLEQDSSLLRELLPRRLRYLGLLGARHRSQLLLTHIARELDWPVEECLQRIHTPIGLALGGDSPEAVALAIVAQIQSVLHSRQGAGQSSAQELLPLVELAERIPPHTEAAPESANDATSRIT